MGFASKAAVSALSGRLAAVIETAVDRRGPAAAAAAEALRREHPGEPAAALARIAINRRSAQLAGSGAVSALPAVLPGPGTAVEVGAALADVSLLTAVQVELIMQIAHLFGRPAIDRHARLLDVGMVLGLDAGAVSLHPGGAVHAMGVAYGREELRGAPADALAQRIGGRLAVQVVARVARRRAHVILGREIPLLGIGIAAGYNLHSTRSLGATALRYFQHIS